MYVAEISIVRSDETYRFAMYEPVVVRLSFVSITVIFSTCLSLIDTHESAPNITPSLYLTAILYQQLVKRVPIQSLEQDFDIHGGPQTKVKQLVIGKEVKKKADS